ncbi:MAG: hypothetical protein LC802_10565 [Acidobacteria bacterium]|nr:hypothetical protein [Acidobacteriota bacterium]
MSYFLRASFFVQRFSRQSVVAGLAAALLLLSSIFFHPQARSQQQDEDEVVRVESDLVILNITVTDRQGRYVHKLTRADFKVFEDRREQAINFFSVEETPFAAAILLDTSGSMEGRVSLARAASIRFLDGLRTDDVAAVYKWTWVTLMRQAGQPSG